MTAATHATHATQPTGWRRSSFSGTQVSDNCVELRWVRSTFSGTAGGNCVELARATSDASPQRLYVRDSKNAHGPRLNLRAEALAGLTGYASARTREA